MGKYLTYHHLHPFSSIVWMISFLLTTLLVNSLLFLSIFFIVLLIIVVSLEIIDEWTNIIPFFLSFGLVLTFINLTVNHSGEHILWYGPRIPVLGKIDVSLEEIIYNIIMLIKLISMLTVFFIYQRVVDIDSTFSYLSRLFPRWMLIISLTTRSIPKITMDFIRIKQVMTIRGVNWQATKGKLFKQYLLLLKALVLSTLEGAWETAEAIHARGYGRQKRTIYRKSGWHKKDTISTLLLLNYYLLIILEWEVLV